MPAKKKAAKKPKAGLDGPSPPASRKSKKLIPTPSNDSLSPLSSPDHQVTLSPPRRSVSIKQEQMEVELIQAMFIEPEREPSPELALPPIATARFPSKFSSLRLSLERSLIITVQGMRKRRASLPIESRNLPISTEEMEEIVEKIQGDCQGLLSPAVLEGEEEEVWSKECRRSIIHAALEEMIFSVTLEQTENVVVSHEDSTPFTIVYDVLDLVLTFSEKDLIESAVPLSCIASLFDIQTISACFHVFAYLESRVVRLAKDMQAGKGKALVLLKCLNELLRRLPRSKTEHVIFCGRILLFLSGVFALGEQSGVNLRGNFNLGKITAFTETEVKIAGEEEMDVDSKVDIADDPEFYNTFWSLQKYFTNPQSLFTAPANPSIAKLPPIRSLPSTPLASTSHTSSSPAPASSSGLEAVRSGLLKTLEVFAANTKKELELAGSSSGATKKTIAPEQTEYYFFPKFLTSPNLLQLELADPAFSRQILIQALVLFQYVLAHVPGGKLENAIPGQKLNAEDAIWMESLRLKIITELESMNPGGRPFQRTIEHILRREHNWINWKLSGCPSIEKPPMDPKISAIASTKLTTLIKPPKDWSYALGNPTLTRLWTKNLKSLTEFQAVESEENFDDLARNWRTTNRMINQKNGQLNAARASPTTPALEEKILELSMELEALNKKSKVLNWRAIRIASTTHLHLFHLIKSGDLNLLLNAMDAERRTRLDLEEAVENGDAIPEVVEEEHLLAEEEREEKERIEREAITLLESKEPMEELTVESNQEPPSPVKRGREEDVEMKEGEAKKLKEA